MVTITHLDAVTTVDSFDPARDLFDVATLLAEGETEVESLRAQRAAGDWAALYETGYRMHARGRRGLHDLLRAREKLNAETRAIRSRGDGEVLSPDEVAELDEPNPDLGDEARQRLDNSFVAELVDTEALADDLEAGNVPVAESPTDPDDDARVNTFPRMLREQRDHLTWLVCNGFGRMVNARVYEAIDTVEPTEHDDAVVEAIEERLAELRERARSLLRTYYAALVEEEFDRLTAAAYRGASYPDELVEELGTLGRRLREARRGHLESGGRWAESRATRVARVEMRLGRTVRLLAFLLAASYRHLFLARQGGVDEESRDAVETARETHFESLVRDGVNADVDDLLDEPSEYDGRFVEVEGFAENVRHVTDDGYGTKFDLVDIYHERRIEVFYPYRNLTDVLLHDGAYLWLNGEFTASCEHADGGPDIHLDRVNVGEHGEKSWFDHLVSDLDGANVYEFHPLDANAAWSIEPPAGGGDD